MADLVGLDVKGMDKVLETLRRLPPEVVSKRGGPVKLALAKGARMMRDAIKAAAPVLTGTLRDNIVSGRAKTDSGERQVVRVRPEVMKYANTRRNVRKRRVGHSYETGGPAFYWRFVESGTKRMPAHPFAGPAARANTPQVIEAVQVDLIRRVDVIVKRLAK